MTWHPDALAKQAAGQTYYFTAAQTEVIADAPSALIANMTFTKTTVTSSKDDMRRIYRWLEAADYDLAQRTREAIVTNWARRANS